MSDEQAKGVPPSGDEAATRPAVLGHAKREIRCPWCESLQVEQVGAIGSHLMVSQYICLACHCPFEVIRR